MNIELVTSPPAEVLIGDRVLLDFKVGGLEGTVAEDLRAELPDDEDLSKIRIFKNKRVEKDGEVHWNLEFTFYVSGDQQVPPLKFFLIGHEHESIYSDPVKFKITSAHDGSQDFQRIIPQMDIIVPREETFFYWYLGAGAGSFLILSLLVYLIVFRKNKRKRRKAIETAIVQSSKYFSSAQKAGSVSTYGHQASLALRYLWEERHGVRYSTMTLDEIKERLRESGGKIDLELLKELDDLKYSTLNVTGDRLEKIKDRVNKEFGL